MRDYIMDITTKLDHIDKLKTYVSVYCILYFSYEKI